MRTPLFAFALALATLALPAAAKEDPEREVYDCGVMRACTVGAPCREDDTYAELVFQSWTEAQITFDGDGPHDVALHPELRTGAWRMGNITMQIVLTGDGGARLTVVPLMGEAEDTQVLFLHCSPQ
jgi:hypothetical protein